MVPSDGAKECHISTAGQEKMDEKLNATPATFDPFLSEDQQIGTEKITKQDFFPLPIKQSYIIYQFYHNGNRNYYNDSL